MPLPRLIAVALLAACGAALLSLGANAVPLDREECKTLEAQRQSLFTTDIRAALERGPDWVKDNLHSAEQIEKVRQYLLVEEKLKFRCRTDGVVMPRPDQVPMPDRKPPLPQHQIAATEPTKILAGAAAISLLPLRKPSLSGPESADAGDAAEDAGDAADDASDAAVDASDTASAAPEPGIAEAEPLETTSSADSDPGPSQAVADSDKTTSPTIKATQ